ncbi:hypothetical protein NQ318_010089 [Aromia moschata]|uniref:Uncharacterized protein n=1 Tax=Aromia moschata TaxID=1265417 RepID=A0AAV8Y9B2_9CUCU|nr:hypothetical protein NQ318_010089 [Aromia moschata]
MRAVWDFINYWYFRYLLVTELYMVEKWERVMFHIIVFTLLFIFYLFNTTIVVGLVKMVTDGIFNQGNLSQSEYGGIASNDEL